MSRPLLNWKSLAIAFVCWSGVASAGLINPSAVERIAGDGGSGGDVGQYSSLAEDASGGQFIAYYDATFQKLKLAHRTSPAAAWVVDSVSTSSSLGQYCSIAVGPIQSVAVNGDFTAGSPTVVIRSGLVVSKLLLGGIVSSGSSYDIAGIDTVSTTKTLTLATPYGGSTATNVAFGVDFYQPTISFQAAGATRRLMVARPKGNGDWIFDTVDGPGTGFGSNFTGFDTSLAISGDGRIHVAYRDGETSGVSTQVFHQSHNTTDTATNVLRYAVYSGGVWKVRTPDAESDHGYGARLVIDNNYAPIILHRDNQKGRLLATWMDSPTSTTWNQAVVDSRSGAGLGIGAAFFPAGNKVVVVHHEQAGTSVSAFNNLMISTGVRNSAGWSFSLHSVATGPGVGDFAGVAHGSTTGTLSISYYDSAAKTLTRQALGSAIAPTTASLRRTLDASTDTGRYTSPLIDGSDFYSAYYDASRRALKIASDDGATTTAAFVDGVKFGTDSSIGLTSTHVVVAYYAQTEGTLHLARWLRGDSPSGASFSDTILDASSTDVGESVRLAIDGNDTIFLAYIDRSNKTLRGAMVFSNWAAQTGTIAGGADGVVVGDYCDIALNHAVPADKVAVVYQAISGPGAPSLYPTIFTGAAGPLPAANPGSYNLAFVKGAATVPQQANLGRYCSAAYDNSGNLHIAYFDDGALAPAYAVISSGGGSGASQIIAGTLFDHGGLELSLAINPNTGEPGVAYYNITDASLRYAELSGSQWFAARVDASGGDTGHTPILRFDKANGYARIAYYNKSTGEFRLATHSLLGGGLIADEVWQDTTLLGDTMGVHPSMAIDVNGSMAFSFGQATSGDLLTTIGAVVPFLSAADGAWLSLP